jgi:arylsulfatase
MALRAGRFKITFAEQRSIGLDVWREPLSQMRLPKFHDLRADPFERGEESFKYVDWMVQQNFLMYSSVPLIAQWLESFKEFPPRSKPASFSIDRIMETMMPKDGFASPAAGKKPELEPAFTKLKEGAQK